MTSNATISENVLSSDRYGIFARDPARSRAIFWSHSMTDGQKAYQEYLQTDKWKTIRAQRLAMDNGECVLCGSPAKHVHHRRYTKEWGTETVRDLVSLCNDCHNWHHHNRVLGEKENLVVLYFSNYGQTSMSTFSPHGTIVDEQTLDKMLKGFISVANKTIYKKKGKKS